jgi:chromosome segregation ATPase
VRAELTTVIEYTSQAEAQLGGLGGLFAAAGGAILSTALGAIPDFSAAEAEVDGQIELRNTRMAEAEQLANEGDAAQARGTARVTELQTQTSEVQTHQADNDTRIDAQTQRHEELVAFRNSVADEAARQEADNDAWRAEHGPTIQGASA